MYVLGISGHHSDAAAALLKDGRIIAAIEEEKLARVSRIGISQFPDVDFPNITVQVTWEGAAPEAIEADVVEIIEEALTQVEGITSISSTSRQGNAAPAGATRASG